MTTKLRYFAVIGLLSLAACGSGLETAKATVLSNATALARSSNDFAQFNETPNITTAQNMVDAITESALDIIDSPYDITEASQILATSCATITLTLDGGETVSAHIKLETTLEGSVVAVPAEGPCQA
jgi:hypothetical protein